jgi:hypothetical protein
MPTRVVHFKKEAHDVYIGRPSIWGNPFSHKANTVAKYKVASVDEALVEYERWLRAQPGLIRLARRTLRGKVLGCWCAPKRCHGDILARIADEDEV